MAATWTVAVASEQQVIVEGAQRAGETVRTSGQHVPLLHALEQVVPASYSVNVPNAGAWADMPVSWHAGGSFVRVLGEMLSANPQLQARVDTDLRIVTVSAVPRAQLPAAAQAMQATTAPPASLAPAESVISAPPADRTQSSATAARSTPDAAQTVRAVPPMLAPAAPVAATPRPAASPASPAPTVVSASTAVAGPPGLPLTPGAPPAADAASADAAPAAPPPTQQVWELRESDGSVRNALQRWAREAGWQFVWDVPTDFTVDANATIHGSLDEALREVVDALSHAQVPIQVVLYKGNRVLRVIPKGGG